MPDRPRFIAGEPLAPFAERTLTALFFAAVDRYRTMPALGQATSPERMTYDEVERHVARIASLLEARGVGRGDRVAILAENRVEWALLDHAVLSLGAVTVPIYPTLPAAQVVEILADCDARAVAVAGPVQRSKLADTPFAARTLPMDELLPRSTPARSGNAMRAWRERARAVAPDDLATIIYTSGTTGTPKGVMLEHRHLAAMVAATNQHASLAVRPGEVALSILPLSHVFERAADYYFFAHGVAVVYAESMQTVVRDIAAVRPHHLVAVPRLFEKVYHAVAGAPGVKGRIARWAAATAFAWAEATTHDRPVSAGLRARHALADRLVYRVLRARMGDRLRTFICGGAPLDPHIGALFHAAGMPVYEGYGLTETAPVIAANQPGRVRLGSAGVPYPGVEIRLGDSDEIQVRSPSVTRGYWERPDDTRAAFTADGWFRTGDVGAIADGFLHVVDRLKDLIVTAGGKNVAPQPIEQRVTAAPHIAQAVLIGDRRPYLVMLVVPGEGIDAGESDEGLARRIAAELAIELRDLGRVERPKRIAIVREEFTVENGMLTPTLKVRRRAVARIHAALLDDVYAGRAGVEVAYGG